MLDLFNLNCGACNCCFPILTDSYSPLNFWFFSPFFLSLLSSFNLPLILYPSSCLAFYACCVPSHPSPSSFLIFNPCPLIFLSHVLIDHFLPLFHFLSLFNLLEFYSFFFHLSSSFLLCSSAYNFFVFSRTDDSGLITHKETLPVRSLVLGDIQRLDSEVAYMVGPLRCHGDSKFPWSSLYLFFLLFFKSKQIFFMYLLFILIVYTLTLTLNYNLPN